MARVVLITGGNVGDAERRLGEAARLIDAEVGRVESHSKIYRTKAWGFESEMLITNAAWEVLTELKPEELLDALQEVEALLGRNRMVEQREKEQKGARYCSRTLDLDILFYDEEHISTERLSVPHPLIMEREFVIEPTCELLQCSKEQLAEKIEKIYG